MATSPPQRIQQLIDMQAQLLAQFQTHFGAPASHEAHAPGRVNLIGEHTDYNDGFVLPCAIDFSTSVALRARTDRQVNILAVNADNATDCFSLDSLITPSPNKPWANYVRGVFNVLQQAGVLLQGLDMAIVGNIPQGTGLSSSASLEVAVIAALCALHGSEASPEQWAHWAQQSENQFVGTQCGIMDMWISATAHANCASLLDCRYLTSQHCHMPKRLQLVIINSKVERGLVGSEYNQRRQQCEQAAKHFGQSSLRDVSMVDLLREEANMDPVVFARARHILTENQRTQSMAQALMTDDVVAISKLMAQSHASMKDDFAITVPAIDHIVEIIHGVIGLEGGVRMTGGGFGGCVVALMPHRLVGACQKALEDNYRAPNGALAEVYLPAIGAGASARELEQVSVLS
jgi:galactokinase